MGLKLIENRFLSLIKNKEVFVENKFPTQSHPTIGLVQGGLRIHGVLRSGVDAVGGRRERVPHLEGCERSQDSLEGHMEPRRQGPPCCCSDIVANLTKLAMTITIMDATVIEIII